MATKITIKNSTATESWLDKMKPEQHVDLRDFVGKTIEITNGFVYESKKYGTGFCFAFREAGAAEYYTTSFGTAIVRQAQELILPVLEVDSAVVKVAARKSKAFNTEYLVFEEA